MNLFKRSLAKNLILLLVILLIANLFSLSLVDRAEASYGMDPKIKQVKTATSPRVYYLDHKRGFKKAYVSADAFLSYGNKWSDIKIISQEQLDRWPDITLVKTTSSPQIYYINNGQKAWIESEQQFIDNGFKWIDAVTISHVDLASYRVSTFDQVRASSSSGGASGLLKISMIPTGHRSLFLPVGSRANIAAVFKLESLGAVAKITNLTFSRGGISSDDIIEAVYLADGSDKVYGQRDGLSAGRFQVNLLSEPLAVAAGDSKILYLKVDLKAMPRLSGQTVKFGILNPLDIAADSQISAVFPLSGPEFRLVDGSGNLGRIRVSQLSLAAAGGQVSLGAKNQALVSFRVSETSGNEDILIKKIVLTNYGTAQDSDLANLSLVANGREIQKGRALSDRKAVFLLTGYLIRRNSNVDFTVKGDVLSGQGRDIKFIINSDHDVTALGKESGYYLAVANDSNIGTASQLIITRSPLFLTQSALKVSESFIYRDQADAVLGFFELRNNQSEIRLTSLTLQILKSSGAPELLDPLVAVDAKSGVRLGAIQPQRILHNFDDLGLGNFRLDKGKTLFIKLMTHIPAAAQSGDSYQIYVKSVNYHIPTDNILYSDPVELSGQRVELVKPALYLYPGQAKSDIVFAGVKQAYLGFFKAEATGDAGVKITSLTISNAPGFTPLTHDRGFSNLALYRGGSRVSDIISAPSSNSYVFNNLKISLNAGNSVEIFVRADIADNAAGQVKLILETAAAADFRNNNIPAEVGNINAASPEVALSRTALAVAGAGENGLVLIGQRDNQIASFSFSNSSEEKIRLGKAVLISAGPGGNFSANNGFHNLRFGFTGENGRIISAGARLARPVADVNQISLGGFTIDAGETLILNLYIDADETASAGIMTIFLRDIEAKGQTSGVNAAVTGLPTGAVEVVVN